jgi:CxxC motif-containing protein
VLTTTAPTVDGGVVPCKTNKPIPRELLFEAMEIINSLSAPATVRIGDVLVSNILDTGADVVVTAHRG